MGVPKRTKGLSAAKTAEGRWCTVRRKGGHSVLLAPDGREFEGTEGEVRAAAMTPERRRMLADAIRAEAAARFDGMALDEWLAEAADALVGAVAGANGGRLPLTRHERAALDRLARRAAAG